MKKESDTDIKDDISVKDLVSKLGVSPENGLNGSEAAERISKYGYNELPEDKTNPLLKFLT